mmetsp:Transcript_48738/g.66304  ORF Transcript_48738/g.66304 Transcript_48738/m.66304 type:complete len:343 (+) Transcript_48738:473-1501(+)
MRVLGLQLVDRAPVLEPQLGIALHDLLVEVEDEVQGDDGKGHFFRLPGVGGNRQKHGELQHHGHDDGEEHRKPAPEDLVAADLEGRELGLRDLVLFTQLRVGLVRKLSDLCGSSQKRRSVFLIRQGVGVVDEDVMVCCRIQLHVGGALPLEDVAQGAERGEHRRKRQGVVDEPDRRLDPGELPLLEGVRDDLVGQEQLHVGADACLDRELQPRPPANHAGVAHGQETVDIPRGDEVLRLGVQPIGQLLRLLRRLLRIVLVAVIVAVALQLPGLKSGPLLAHLGLDWLPRQLEDDEDEERHEEKDDGVLRSRVLHGGHCRRQCVGPRDVRIAHVEGKVNGQPL